MTEREHHYTYTTHSPNPLRMEAGELPQEGHRLKWVNRRDGLAPPGKQMAYNARCTCKWKDQREGVDEYVPKRLLIKRYAIHILDVRKREKEAKQGSLFR